MHSMEESRLKYRRQFLLSREVLPNLSYWNFLSLAPSLYLYAGPDLNLIYKEHKGTKIALLGYLFDPLNSAKSNEEILADISEHAETFESFIETIRGYAGQYVFIFLGNCSFNILHDPLALREVYYCTFINRIICGSQPNLIKEYSNPPVVETDSIAIRKFYADDIKRIRSGRFWIGDETLYEGIKHLLPNHYLDISTLKAGRYWPRKKLPKIELSEAVRLSSSFLKGILRAAAGRCDLMLAVTGGTDSRTLLAASREIKDRIYYFINKHENLHLRHPDIYIPAAIFKKINIPFHIHNVEGEIDKKFREIFLSNTFMSAEKFISVIYNIYYKQHSHRLNILGVGEIGRTFFGNEPKHIDGYYLAWSIKYKNSDYAVRQCQKWVDNTLPIARKFGVNLMTLLLWEQLLGNWGAVGNSESDIAIEEFDPFNSHYLYETLLGVDEKYSKSGDNILFKEIIRNMWPELLAFPINPPHTKSDYFRLGLKKIGLYTPLKLLTYRINRLEYTLAQHLQS